MWMVNQRDGFACFTLRRIQPTVEGNKRNPKKNRLSAANIGFFKGYFNDSVSMVLLNEKGS